MRLGVNRGIVITAIKRGSPAAEAGLRPGDVILEINRQPIRDLKDYYTIIKKTQPGDTLLFLVKRQEGTIFIPVEIPKD